jgi:hypothetical protein
VDDNTSSVSPEFRDLVVGALDGAADSIDVGGVEALAGIVPTWMLGRIDALAARRFAGAARELAGQIEAGLWDWSLPRCTADELLLQRCITEAGWTAEYEGVDPREAEAASEEVLQDDDVLLFFLPDAERVFSTDAPDEAVSDLPSTDPARWFDRFATTGAQRADP